MAQIELAPDHRRADLVNQLAMGVGIGGHAPVYQQPVEVSSALSLIADKCAVRHRIRMSFGLRLEAAIRGSSYKNPNKFASAMGWSAQRVHNYVKGRIPNGAVVAAMAKKLGVQPGDLLSEADEGALRDILLRLLDLEGIQADTADTIANAFLEARRLHSASNGDGDPQMRARLAAQYAWQSQPSREPDR